jgi:hypothetical protein
MVFAGPIIRNTGVFSNPSYESPLLTFCVAKSGDQASLNAAALRLVSTFANGQI